MYVCKYVCLFVYLFVCLYVSLSEVIPLITLPKPNGIDKGFSGGTLH